MPVAAPTNSPIIFHHIFSSHPSLVCALICDARCLMFVRPHLRGAIVSRKTYLGHPETLKAPIGGQRLREMAWFRILLCIHYPAKSAL